MPILWQSDHIDLQEAKRSQSAQHDLRELKVWLWSCLSHCFQHNVCITSQLWACKLPQTKRKWTANCHIFPKQSCANEAVERLKKMSVLQGMAILANCCMHHLRFFNLHPGTNNKCNSSQCSLSYAQAFLVGSFKVSKSLHARRLDTSSTITHFLTAPFLRTFPSWKQSDKSNRESCAEVKLSGNPSKRTWHIHHVHLGLIRVINARDVLFFHWQVKLVHGPSKEPGLNHSFCGLANCDHFVQKQHGFHKPLKTGLDTMFSCGFLILQSLQANRLPWLLAIQMALIARHSNRHVGTSRTSTCCKRLQGHHSTFLIPGSKTPTKEASGDRDTTWVIVPAREPMLSCWVFWPFSRTIQRQLCLCPCARVAPEEAAQLSPESFECLTCKGPSNCTANPNSKGRGRGNDQSPPAKAHRRSKVVVA